MEPSVIQSYMQMIFYRCLKMLRDHDLAWDAAQEVLTRYYEAKTQRSIREPLHYLYRASMHHCLDILRLQKRALPTDVRWLESFRSVRDEHITEGKLMVEHLLRHFSQDEVTLFLYRHVDQMTYTELGEIFGRSDRAMKKRMDRIEQRMHIYLAQ